MSKSSFPGITEVAYTYTNNIVESSFSFKPKVFLCY